MNKADAILLKHLPALKEAARPYQDEEKAYREYISALDAVPYSQQERRQRFSDWQKLYKNLRKGDQALLLVQRIAERYPPELFVYDEDTGSPECIFCGWVGYSPEHEHKPDCMAVLIQEFGASDGYGR